jgi:hypothetical protein
MAKLGLASIWQQRWDMDYHGLHYVHCVLGILAVAVSFLVLPQKNNGKTLQFYCF